MQTNTMHQNLSDIREKYRCIQQMTAALGNDPEQQELDQVLAERAVILDAIAADRLTLDTLCGDWLRKARSNRVLASLMNDIIATIRAIAELDAMITESLARAMHETRTQIRGVYHSSRAVCAYAAHTH